MIDRLKSAGIPLRLCSNYSTESPQTVAATLTSLGFDISPEEVFTPIPAVQHYLRRNNLRPYVIVDPGQYHQDTSAIIFIFLAVISDFFGNTNSTQERL